MSIELELQSIASGYNTQKINSNFAAIQDALIKVLSRDGTTPNNMEADFDLDGNDLLNGGAGAFESLTVGGIDVADLVGAPGADGATGPAGPAGADGADGVDGIMASVVAGSGISVDNTDPANPIISTTGSLADGDKGDIVVSGSGSSWLFDTSVVTAAAKTVLDDATIADMRTTLGLAIGTNVQAYDADLTTWASIAPSVNVQSIVSAADYAAIRTLLGLVIGTNVQAYDADLTTWASLTPSANAQSLVTAADYSAMRTLLALVPGTDVQVFDADLSALAALSGTNTIYYRSAANTWTAVTIGPNIYFTGGTLKAYEVWGGAISDETTAITTGTGKLSFAIPYAFTVVGVYASLNTVSSSGTPTFDINEAGTTILSTKIVIDVSEKTGGSAGYQGTAAGAAVISDSSLAANAEITVDIDVAGTGAKGAKVFIIGYPT